MYLNLAVEVRYQRKHDVSSAYAKDGYASKILTPNLSITMHFSLCYNMQSALVWGAGLFGLYIDFRKAFCLTPHKAKLRFIQSVPFLMIQSTDILMSIT